MRSELERAEILRLAMLEVFHLAQDAHATGESSPTLARIAQITSDLRKSALLRGAFVDTESILWPGPDFDVDTLVGMTLAQAQGSVAKHGLRLRNRSESGWYTDDLNRYRVDVWLSPDDVVERAQRG